MILTGANLESPVEHSLPSSLKPSLSTVSTVSTLVYQCYFFAQADSLAKERAHLGADPADLLEQSKRSSKGDAKYDAEFLAQAKQIQQKDEAKQATRDMLATAQSDARRALQQGLQIAEDSANSALALPAKDYAHDPKVVAGTANSSSHNVEWKQWVRIINQSRPVGLRPLVVQNKKAAFNLWLECSRDTAKCEVVFKRKIIKQNGKGKKAE